MVKEQGRPVQARATTMLAPVLAAYTLLCFAPNLILLLLLFVSQEAAAVVSPIDPLGAGKRANG